ncbi:PREDICTED: LOW QUALITY PROTEIN: uncharacterized protein LOC108549127 [Eufriesea mexicana]|uniref:LOW QUALITY PROTEIN: uncharacterized protein LOC108549127 n=1 Tax=Eufriesea mexicana TaxID=516756 RepID=UPI00083C6EB4|nr:PREDICTED: LOW QUALITY PROTEIN: uncharacterized protein LOC108549127 [Eufriesea mexicana]
MTTSGGGNERSTRDCVCDARNLVAPHHRKRSLDTGTECRSTRRSRKKKKRSRKRWTFRYRSPAHNRTSDRGRDPRSPLVPRKVRSPTTPNNGIKPHRHIDMQYSFPTTHMQIAEQIFGSENMKMNRRHE